VFRRRDAGAGGSVDEAATGEARSGNSQPAAERQAGGGAATTPAKGRPTPKRSEAERRRRQPYSAPGDRKTAARQSRTRDRGERARKYDAMKRGEEWALAPRDKGPVKALARDYVDSRRRISEYYMYILLVLLVILLLKNTALDAILPDLCFLLIFSLVAMTAATRLFKRTL